MIYTFFKFNNCIKKLVTGVLLILSFTALNGQTENGWDVFKKVKFRPKYFADFATNILIPTFKPEIKALEGKEITLSGYVIPITETGWNSNSIILSKVPYSSCFFLWRRGTRNRCRIGNG